MSQLHKHSLVYLAGRIVPALVNLIGTAVFTRMSTPSEYATLVISVAAAQLGSSALFQWLRMSVLRYGAGNESTDVIGTISRLYVIQGGICSAAIISGAFIAILLDGNFTIWISCGLMILAQSWFDYTQELQRSGLKPVAYSLAFGLRSILSIALGTAALFITGSGFALVVGISLAYIIAPLPFAGGMFGRLNPGNHHHLRKKIFRYGVPLGVALFLNNISVVGDRMFVIYFMGAQDAGIYGPIAELGRQSIFMLLQSVTLACYPLAIRALREQGIQAAAKQMESNFGLLMLIALPAAAGLAAMRTEISMLMLGPLFRGPANELFPIVALSTLLLSMNTFYFIQGNQLGENTRGQAIVALIGAVAAIVLNVCLIPAFGLVGAAMASMLAQVAALAASIYVSRKAFPLPIPIRHIVRPAIATAVMYLSILGVQVVWPGHMGLRTLTLFIVAGTSYAVAAFALDVADLRQLTIGFIRRRVTR